MEDRGFDEEDAIMRQYTWDKHLETWVKASGMLGGPKNASPTVISPKQYKKRSQSDLGEENTQGAPSID
ncbi:hypothetical protein OIU84_017466 [Salix udensis]|uniref:Uncharacterized protein n=1 Tax=Salix udensis TaxID=889485 RepID=A0AAD6PMI2_9ROSI|nr:hypothetical protein OIU84_017466 [Salix udensis]